MRTALTQSWFHPRGLALAKELLPLGRYGTDDEDLQGAQRRYSSVIHHDAWLLHLIECQGASRREAVRFVAVSQPHAGTYINAVPAKHGFRVPTWALRLQTQRRLGLPLLAASTLAAPGAFSSVSTPKPSGAVVPNVALSLSLLSV